MGKKKGMLAKGSQIDNEENSVSDNSGDVPAPANRSSVTTTTLMASMSGGVPISASSSASLAATAASSSLGRRSEAVSAGTMVHTDYQDASSASRRVPAISFGSSSAPGIPTPKSPRKHQIGGEEQSPASSPWKVRLFGKSVSSASSASTSATPPFRQDDEHDIETLRQEFTHSSSIEKKKAVAPGFRVTTSGQLERTPSGEEMFRQEQAASASSKLGFSIFRKKNAHGKNGEPISSNTSQESLTQSAGELEQYSAAQGSSSPNLASSASASASLSPGVSSPNIGTRNPGKRMRGITGFLNIFSPSSSSNINTGTQFSPPAATRLQSPAGLASASSSSSSIGSSSKPFAEPSSNNNKGAARRPKPSIQIGVPSWRPNSSTESPQPEAIPLGGGSRPPSGNFTFRNAASSSSSSSTGEEGFSFGARRIPSSTQVPEISMIEPHLFLGSIAAVYNVSRLQSLGIRAIIDCTHVGDDSEHVGAPPPALDPLVQVYRLDLHDRSTEDVSANFYNGIEVIERTRKAGGAVLVHCVMGVSRSPAIVMAYEIWRHRLDFKTAFDSVKALRPCVNPNPNFVFQLYAWGSSRPQGLFSDVPITPTSAQLKQAEGPFLFVYEVQLPKTTCTLHGLPIILGPLSNVNETLFAGGVSDAAASLSSENNGRVFLLYFLANRRSEYLSFHWSSANGVSESLLQASKRAAAQLTEYEKLPPFEVIHPVIQGSEPAKFFEILKS